MRIIAIILWISVTASVAADDGFEDLFNGRDLTGWNGDAQIWSVEDGLLTGLTRSAQDIDQNTFAIWTGGEVDDFLLRVTFRLQGDNNSGVQYRSRRRSETMPWSVVGYQADLHPAVNYVGMLHEEGGRGIIAERGQKATIEANGSKRIEQTETNSEPIKLDDWNEIEITAIGSRLVHKLNGQVTVEVIDGDTKNAKSKGLIALQVHAGPPMKVQFKTIKLKRLTPERAARLEVTSFVDAATPVDDIKSPPGFKVDLLYSVPREQEGSWVNMCVDPKQRLIVSDQYGGLYRVTLPEIGRSNGVKVEAIPIELGQAQGLLWAFDSLYVVVNGDREKYKNGLYRVRDSDGDDTLDSVELLRELDGAGEHGPHAVLLTPDGKSLLVVCGNDTRPTDVVRSHVPTIWDEDQLLPRLYGVGFMKGVSPPAGCIYQVDPDGKKWERFSSGFRNQFDAAVNGDGELFTFDADMEWDVGAPWYRPTRVCHVVSGSDWGWRVSSAKWPAYYADTLPPVVDVGLGSPTGVTFGYGAKFPAKYQRALYLCDWTYGKMYTVGLEPRGSTYSGKLEEFITASPLPLTDVIINPHDGAMYFLIGGRRTQSGLYRVTYVGDEATEPVSTSQEGSENRTARRRLEATHANDQPSAVDQAWPYLKDTDRFMRHAARTALEHQPLETWQQRALQENDPQASLTALLALVRMIPRSYQPTGAELDTPPPVFPANDAKRHPLHGAVLDVLHRLDWPNLSTEQQLELLRIYALALYRMGPPDESERDRLIDRLDRLYPAKQREVNVLLTELLCYLQADSVAAKGMALLNDARTQEEQIDLARSLRFLETGWSSEARRGFFEWILKSSAYKGGNNFATLSQEIRTDALARLPEEAKANLAAIIDAPPPDQVTSLSTGPRPFVKEWTLEELVPQFETKLRGRDFSRGREMFAAARCYDCHRFAGEGGAVGPDLTGLAGRFSARDLLESVIEPDKVISDQYVALQIQTSAGKVVVGRIVNYDGDEIYVNTDMLDPSKLEKIKRQEIEMSSPSTISMMPTGLMNTLNEEEVFDLMAFLLSRGNQKHTMFAK